jgi:DMSO/TMAO reductase YedYZ molybdopterin-dependent catalytic subunit
MSTVRTGCILSLLLFLSGDTSVPAQDQPKPKPAELKAIISVKGEVEHPFELTAAEFAKLPRQTVHAKDHDGKEADYEGVALVELLKAAGVKLGQDLRGKALASYLVVEASDGYRAVFALPELDPAFSERVILLADSRDKKPLDERHGPLQIIVPGEKRHARWVRQVISLKIGHASA